MKKIIVLHGFFASGSCTAAVALKQAFEGKAEVLTPDLPLHPKEALEFVRRLCDREKPDLLAGNSCGSFLAQILAPVAGIPALLGNPHFAMSEFLAARMGTHPYKSPRKDGKTELTIDQALVDEFAGLEGTQFDYCNPYYKDKVWGLFGEQDTLAHYEPLFLQHYNEVFHFPGGHTPTAEEVKTWYVPLVEKMLLTFHKPDDGFRYFIHIKGGTYRFIHSAFDCGTMERMAVYQALGGDKEYWVRPEREFFGKVEMDGKQFNRFVETNLAEP